MRPREAESSRLDTFDRAELSEAAQALLIEHPVPERSIDDPQRLAQETMLSATSSIAVAGAIHTAAVARAARLIR